MFFFFKPLCDISVHTFRGLIKKILFNHACFLLSPILHLDLQLDKHPKTFHFKTLDYDLKCNNHTTWHTDGKCSLLYGLSCVLSEPNDGSTTQHVSLFCTIKMLCGRNNRVNGQSNVALHTCLNCYFRNSYQLRGLCSSMSVTKL